MVLVVFLASTCFAQYKRESEVKKAVEELHQAMINADSAALSRIVSPMLVYVHSSGVVDHKKQFIEKIVSGQSDFVTIIAAEPFVSVNRKTAIVRHVLLADTNDNGKPGKVQIRIMQVWQKEAGRWKLLARQAAKML